MYSNGYILLVCLKFSKLISSLNFDMVKQQQNIFMNCLCHATNIFYVSINLCILILHNTAIFFNSDMLITYMFICA